MLPLREYGVAVPWGSGLNSTPQGHQLLIRTWRESNPRPSA
jgi:hypothetical protein